MIHGVSQHHSAQHGHKAHEKELLVYDSAQTQFFIYIIKRLFLDPEDFQECILTSENGYSIPRDMVINTVGELFVLTKSKEPETFKEFEKKVMELRLIESDIDSRPQVSFEETIGLLMSFFPTERGNHQSADATKRSTKAKKVLQKLFRNARTGVLPFKLKQLANLQNAFERYDELHHGLDFRGVFTFSSFERLLNDGMGIRDIDQRLVLKLFNEFQNVTEEETGWEKYMEANNMLGGADHKVFFKLQKQLQDDSWKADTRDEAQKRHSIMMSSSQQASPGGSDAQKKFHLHEYSALKMRSIFYTSSFTAVDLDLGKKVEVSRGALAAKFAFSRVMYKNNLFAPAGVEGADRGDRGNLSNGACIAEIDDEEEGW